MTEKDVLPESLREKRREEQPFSSEETRK